MLSDLVTFSCSSFKKQILQIIFEQQGKNLMREYQMYIQLPEDVLY